MKNSLPPPPLALTCDALESVLSDTSPLAVMRARPFLVDLVRGIRELAERVDQVQRTANAAAPWREPPGTRHGGT